jgi:hypothetical protein
VPCGLITQQPLEKELTRLFLGGKPTFATSISSFEIIGLPNAAIISQTVLILIVVLAIEAVSPTTYRVCLQLMSEF